MSLQIQFSGADLASASFAEGPDPFWEVLLSLHALQTEDGGPAIRQWRATVPVDGPTRRLFSIAPSKGYSPDFLTPHEGVHGFDEGMDALLRTPRSRLSRDLTLLIGPRRAPAWARSLADGGTVLRELGQALSRYYHGTIRPFWPQIERQVHRDRTGRARTMISHGLGAALESLHPQLRWHGTALELTGKHVSGELLLDGRGIRIVPSFFCYGAPTVLFDTSLPPVLVYPIEPGPLSTGPGLAALLGPARARILAGIGTGATTTDLSGIAAISPAATSYHTTILADAGLIRKRRVGSRVVHTLTPLGSDLLIMTGSRTELD